MHEVWDWLRTLLCRRPQQVPNGLMGAWLLLRPECNGEENEEWIDREPMTDERRRDDLPLQCGDAEMGVAARQLILDLGRRAKDAETSSQL